MNAGQLFKPKGLLFTCLTLIVGSIVLQPASVHLGVGCGISSTISSLALMGGIGAAFMTVKAEMEAGKP